MCEFEAYARENELLRAEVGQVRQAIQALREKLCCVGQRLVSSEMRLERLETTFKSPVCLPTRFSSEVLDGCNFQAQESL